MGGRSFVLGVARMTSSRWTLHSIPGRSHLRMYLLILSFRSICYEAVDLSKPSLGSFHALGLNVRGQVDVEKDSTLTMRDRGQISGVYIQVLAVCPKSHSSAAQELDVCLQFEGPAAVPSNRKRCMGRHLPCETLQPTE